jgi:hypothetical protein
MRAFCAIAVAALLPLSSVDAATATFSAVSGLGPSNPNVSVGRSPSAVQISHGVPADARIHEFLVTTDADILEIERVEILSSEPIALYQVPPSWGGTDTEPPTPAFEDLVPELGADSWITTPGATSTLDNSEPFPVLWQFFDVTNDGPVADFMFARITVSQPAEFRITGRVGVVGAAGLEYFNFEFFTIPEPASLGALCVSLLGLAALRRRYN